MNELAIINEEGKIEIADKVIKEIEKFQKQKLKMDIMQEELKDKLKSLMEQTNSTKFVSSDGVVTVNYFPEKVTKKLDSKRLKEEKPELYEEYLKDSITRSYVKLTVK